MHKVCINAILEPVDSVRIKLAQVKVISFTHGPCLLDDLGILNDLAV